MGAMMACEQGHIREHTRERQWSNPGGGVCYRDDL